MFRRIYLGIGGLMIVGYAAVALSGREFGKAVTNSTMRPHSSTRYTTNHGHSRHGSRGFWFGGGGGYWGGK